MYGHDGTVDRVVCILCCTDHNQYHETFSCNKDSLCVLSSACSALNFRHIQSVLIVFHTLTIFCCCQTQDGISPVYVASQNGHMEIVDLLVQAGADTNKVHVSTHSVLFKTSKHAYPDGGLQIAEIPLEGGASLGSQ